MTGVAKKEIDFEKITKQNDENLLIICDDLDLYYSMKISEIAEHFFINDRHRNRKWFNQFFNKSAFKKITKSHVSYIL